jgi:hypothetical protein
MSTNRCDETAVWHAFCFTRDPCREVRCRKLDERLRESTMAAQPCAVCAARSSHRAGPARIGHCLFHEQRFGDLPGGSVAGRGVGRGRRGRRREWDLRCERTRGRRRRCRKVRPRPRRSSSTAPDQPATISRDANSPIMMLGALVLAEGIVGITDASAMRRPSTPRTRNSASTTASRSDPMAQVPTRWR